jgi:hypothetical protein
MATIDEELSQLERDIRQLKIEYDQFFGGGRKRPPSEVEWRIDSLIKRYSERMGQLKFGQSFRFNNLAQTYAKYKEIFRKRLQQKEEGKVERHYGSAAKAIEAERAQRHAAEAAAQPAERGAAFRISCSAPDSESEKVEQLYQAFISAKEKAGEPTEKLTRANFGEFVRKKTSDLQKQKGVKEVEYVVEVVGDQVKLKALTKS